jgi:hypothetical protein
VSGGVRCASRPSGRFLSGGATTTLGRRRNDLRRGAAEMASGVMRRPTTLWSVRWLSRAALPLVNRLAAGKNAPPVSSCLALLRHRQSVTLGRDVQLHSLSHYARCSPAGNARPKATLVPCCEKRPWASAVARCTPARRGCGSLIWTTLVQLVCTTGWGRRSPRKNMTAVVKMICRSSHNEALRIHHSSSYSFHRPSAARRH